MEEFRNKFGRFYIGFEDGKGIVFDREPFSTNPIGSDDIEKYIESFIHSAIEQAFKAVEVKRMAHVIDREVYENSGGVVMCENCGMGQYNENWEKPCETYENSAISEYQSNINKFWEEK